MIIDTWQEIGIRLGRWIINKYSRMTFILSIAFQWIKDTRETCITRAFSKISKVSALLRQANPDKLGAYTSYIDIIMSCDQTSVCCLIKMFDFIKLPYFVLISKLFFRLHPNVDLFQFPSREFPSLSSSSELLFLPACPSYWQKSDKVWLIPRIPGGNWSQGWSGVAKRIE